MKAKRVTPPLLPPDVAVIRRMYQQHVGRPLTTLQVEALGYGIEAAFRIQVAGEVDPMSVALQGIVHEPGVVRCSVSRRNARFKAELCNGFVIRVGRRTLGLGQVEHSERAPEGADVVACRRCGALHVFARPPPEP